MPERVIDSGSLSTALVVDLAATAAQAAHPAILKLHRGEVNRWFYFRDGTLSALSVDSPAEALTSMLVRRKKLQPAVAQAVQQVAARDGMSEAQVVMRDRMLPMPELIAEMNLWASLLLVQSFGWSEGTWSIEYESSTDLAPDALLDLRLPALLLKGVEKRMPIDEVRALLEPYASTTPTPADPAPFALDGFDLDGKDRDLWQGFDGSRSLAQSLAMTPVASDRAAQLVFTWLRMGMLETNAAAPEASVADWAFDDGLFDDLGGGAAPTAPAASPAVSPPAPPSPVAPPAVSPPAPSVDPAPPPASAVLGAAVPTEPRPDESVTSPGSADSGIDWSQISFRPRETTNARVSGGQRERLSGLGEGPVHVEVGHGRADEISQEMPAVPAPEEATPAPPDALVGLFDGLGLDPGAPSGPVAPPRAGRRAAPSYASSIAPPAPPAPGPAPTTPSDPPPPSAASATGAADWPPGPPRGPGPEIELDAWARLSSKDKDRVRGLKRELQKMASTNYFEWFGVSHEVPVGSIKKAYFQMAKRYHPDALVDESPAFAELAEALFARYSEAYEVLSDDAARDKYIRKAIHGEKDEDELAMERVKAILEAEDSFKRGVRALNAGRLADALKRFKAAVDGYDEEAEYVAYYGYTLFRAKSRAAPDEAERGLDLVRKATELKPGASKPWHLLGKIYLQKTDGSRAKKYLRQALKIRPDDAEALRDYRAADAMSKAQVEADAAPEGGLKGLFGRLGRKKEDPKPEDPLKDFDFDF